MLAFDTFIIQATTVYTFEMEDPNTSQNASGIPQSSSYNHVLPPVPTGSDFFVGRSRSNQIGLTTYQHRLRLYSSKGSSCDDKRCSEFEHLETIS